MLAHHAEKVGVPGNDGGPVKVGVPDGHMKFDAPSALWSLVSWSSSPSAAFPSSSESSRSVVLPSASAKYTVKSFFGCSDWEVRREDRAGPAIGAASPSLTGNMLDTRANSLLKRSKGVESMPSSSEDEELQALPKSMPGGSSYCTGKAGVPVQALEEAPFLSHSTSEAPRGYAEPRCRSDSNSGPPKD